MPWTFKKAETKDCEGLAELINGAYRGDGSRAGWTTEAHILDGLRTDAEALRKVIGRPGSTMLLALDRDGKLMGSVHLERRSEKSCYLGMLSVRPLRQAQGLGKALLSTSENFARETFGSSMMEMTVITERRELLEWYERRGYVRTGKRVPFPVHPKFGVLKVPSLEMEVLEKPI